MAKLVTYEGPDDELQVEDEKGKRALFVRGQEQEVTDALAKVAEAVEGHQVKVSSPK